MKFNPETHHRRSIRLKEFDYSQAGYYFVTICTNVLTIHESVRSVDRRSPSPLLFGHIENGNIILNEFGQIVKDWLNNIPEHFQDVSIDYNCIMPNHVHLIIIIEPNVQNVGAIHELPLRIQRRNMMLGKIIGYFKMNTAKQINQIRNTPGFTVWQRNYYEHIIRNEKALYSIRKYIEYNPLNWIEDEYYI